MKGVRLITTSKVIWYAMKGAHQSGPKQAKPDLVPKLTSYCSIRRRSPLPLPPDLLTSLPPDLLTSCSSLGWGTCRAKPHALACMHEAPFLLRRVVRVVPEEALPAHDAVLCRRASGLALIHKCTVLDEPAVLGALSEDPCACERDAHASERDAHASERGVSARERDMPASGIAYSCIAS